MTPRVPLDFAELYRVVAESATDAIVTIDGRSSIIAVNPAATRLFGYAEDELVGRSLSDLIPERLREAHRQGMARYLATGKRSIPWTGVRVPVRTKSGGEIPVDISFGDFVTQGQRMFSGIFRDLRDREKFEAELAATNKTLQDQAMELELQAEEAQVLTEELEQANEELQHTLARAEMSRRRAQFLADATQQLASSLDHGATIRAVVRAAVPMLGDWCAVDLVADPDSTEWPPELERIAIHHQDPAKLALAERLERDYPRDWTQDVGIVGVLRTGTPFFVPRIPADLLRTAARDAEHLAILESLNFSSIIAVPLESDGRRVGVLTLAATESGRTYDAEDLELARELATRAAVAVGHSRLYREAVSARRSAEVAGERTLRLQAATAALAEATTREEVAEAVLTEGLRALGARDGVLCVITDDGARLEIVQAVGLHERTVGEYRTFPLDGPLPLSEAVRTRTPIYTRDKTAFAMQFPALREANARAATEGWAQVPLIVDGVPVGGIAWGFTEVRDFSAEERAFIETLAAQCGQALDRVRLLHAERASREAAEEANRAKSEFLATMSHELRTPLNAIAGHTQLIELGIHGAITDAQREALERVQRSQGHLLNLINDVLNYAKIEAGSLEYRYEDIPVKSVLAGLEDMTLPQLAAKRLAYRVDACEENPIVRADADKLQQVLLNLLSNAVKFTPDGGAVTLRCTTDGPRVLISVEDTGIGIPDEKLNDVFEPFVQVDRTLTSTHEGAGLGLAISRDLARAMGGDLTATSQLGVGSVFTLALPRAQGMGSEL